MFVKVFKSNERRSFERDINKYLEEIKNLKNYKSAEIQYCPTEFYSTPSTSKFSYNAMVVVRTTDEEV